MTNRNKSVFWNTNFLALLQGTAVSKFGSVGFVIAVTLVLKELTDSGIIMAIVLGMSAISAILFSSYAGTVVDKTNLKQGIMIKADLVAFVVCLGLALLFYLVNETIVRVLALTVVLFVLSVCQSFYNVSARSLLPQILVSEHYLRANSNLSSSNSFASVLGQSFAAIFLATLGPILFFILDALTYLYSSICAFFIRKGRKRPVFASEQRVSFSLTKILSESKRSWEYSKSFPDLIGVFYLVAIVNFISAPTAMYLAFLTEDHLGLDSSWYAWFMAFLTIGALTGAFIAKKLKDTNRFNIVIVSLTILSVAKMLVALSTHYIVSLVLLFIEANLYTILSILIVTTVQEKTPKDNLGKIFGIVDVFGRVAMPMGLMIGGFLVDFTQKNMMLVFSINSVALFCVTLFFLQFKPLRGFFNGEPVLQQQLVKE